MTNTDEFHILEPPLFIDDELDSSEIQIHVMNTIWRSSVGICLRWVFAEHLQME